MIKQLSGHLVAFQSRCGLRHEAEREGSQARREEKLPKLREEHVLRP